MAWERTFDSVFCRQSTADAGSSSVFQYFCNAFARSCTQRNDMHTNHCCEDRNYPSSTFHSRNGCWNWPVYCKGDNNFHIHLLTVFKMKRKINFYMEIWKYKRMGMLRTWMASHVIDPIARRKIFLILAKNAHCMNGAVMITLFRFERSLAIVHKINHFRWNTCYKHFAPFVISGKMGHHTTFASFAAQWTYLGFLTDPIQWLVCIS